MKPKLLPLVALLAAGPAGAEGLRAEIVERVVERCYAATVCGLDAGERERLYDVAFVQCFVSGGEHL